MKTSKEEIRAKRAVAPKKEKSTNKKTLTGLTRRRIEALKEKVIAITYAEKTYEYSDFEMYLFLVGTMQYLNENEDNSLDEMIMKFLEQPEMIQVKDNFGVEYDYWVKTKKIF